MENTYYKNYFDSISRGLETIQYLISQKEVGPSFFYKSIRKELDLLRNSNGKIYFFGNGASAAFANHMALDFAKNGRLVSRSLSDSAFLTALANDFSYEQAMVEYLKVDCVNKNDLIVTISSSGNSANIINVLNYCKGNNLRSLALSGLKMHNKSTKIADYSLYIPMKTYGMVECLHQVVLHLILDEYMGIEEWSRNDYQDMNYLNLKY